MAIGWGGNHFPPPSQQHQLPNGRRELVGKHTQHPHRPAALSGVIEQYYRYPVDFLHTVRRHVQCHLPAERREIVVAQLDRHGPSR